MLDSSAQANYWRDTANEDWAAANALLRQGHTRHALFLAHLALEKALKAHYSLRTNDLPPRIHNLVRLALLAELQLSEEQFALWADMNAFNIEVRYPDAIGSAPTTQEAKAYF